MSPMIWFVSSSPTLNEKNAVEFFGVLVGAFRHLQYGGEKDDRFSAYQSGTGLERLSTSTSNIEQLLAYQRIRHIKIESLKTASTNVIYVQCFRSFEKKN